MKRNKNLKRIGRLIIAVFLFMNVVAFFHAWKFTHFTTAAVAKTNADQLTMADKIKVALLGISNPRPVNTAVPAQPYKLVKIKSNKHLEGWLITSDTSKGTVILFHGYGGSKSSMLQKSDEFIKLGYSTLLIDFMGSGESEGNQTTIGFKEAIEVTSSYNYLVAHGEKNIILFGTSLGAVAIMKAMADDELKPSAIIIECPFGSLYQTTVTRFKMMHVPAFPMAGLLVFWGGVQNGFSGFAHKPTGYARSIKCPALLLYGEKDDRVSRKEIDAIYSNLAGKKMLKTFPLAGHDNYLRVAKNDWLNAVDTFLTNLE